ncbi:TPA: hypothetical protein ACM25J_001033 [Neisseria meningitidis]|uniref:hypothetical protein n=1 Tax=Neisseria meningitidis TaxID=487 RepID=UPI00128FD890|nr:hypothetical protein [Neisseria meningitidis]
MPSERLQTAFFTQSPPFPIIPYNTVILKSVIPAQAGIQGVKSKETVLSDKFPQQQTRFPPARE